MTYRELYRKYFAVHKCGGCGEILPWQISDRALCESCRTAWNEQTVESCQKCFLPARMCGCMPKHLEKSGALTLRKLFFYNENKTHVSGMGVLYRLKHRKIRRVISLVAEELCASVREELSVFGELSCDEAVITYVPRGKRSLRLHGFDQSRLVARRLSELCGYEYVDMFKTVRQSRQQKQLDGSSRLKNARSGIRLDRGKDIGGKYAVIFDDVVTTGASMSVCTERLMRAGARGVICVCLTAKPQK